ncbi:hypothetical protein SAMN05661080_04327 [Modestobacter sp. DSM 44400]|uniref:hypothetical protein n=1 Tax=Modestobacter sp. DSM 44400 TaxID=1550230 RepID=UPI00089CB786|nr:hypothetical protein [Modestobacter sp. DSM 44400]SDY69936.1 hypothetical protein SAMN05661080_04327 [Modestobacter sp. DSM 44400]
MGRLIAVVLFIALMAPAALLFRAWGLASGRRQVANAGVEFATPTPAGSAYLARQATHGRRVRRLGLLLGVVAVVVSVVLFAEASVFLWLPALATGLLTGVLLAEASRPRPRWALSSPPRRPQQGDQISPWLLWTMRAAVAGDVLAAVLLTDELDRPVTVTALVVPLVAWLLAEGALLRVLVRPLAAEGADVPVDEAQRTWTAHLAVAAASVLALLPLGSLLLVAGIGLSGEVSGEGAGLVPVALVAGGFSALAAGLAVAGYLISWLPPVRHTSPALAG